MTTTQPHDPTFRTEMPVTANGPVILFDGVCNLCNGAVTWVIERDTHAQFRFASLQSDAARSALSSVAAPAIMPDSIVLLDADGVHVRSDAALRIGAALGFPWSLLSLARIVPRVIRDAVYDYIARNRYRWFGRRDVCMLPAPGVANRFLD